MKSTETLTITTPTDRELVMTRVFDAPRSLVFDAFTRPELLRRWYGPEGYVMVVCEIDLRAGGAWRYVTRKPDGKEVGQRGVYREVIRPERIVRTESWEDWNPGELLVTTTFDEHDGRTTMASTTFFPTQELRDFLVKCGAADQSGASYDRLERLLESIR